MSTSRTNKSENCRRIVNIRELSNRTQIQLAAMLGIGTQTLRAWEQGVYNPPAEMVVKASRVTGIPTTCPACGHRVGGEAG